MNITLLIMSSLNHIMSKAVKGPHNIGSYIMPSIAFILLPNVNW